MAPRRPEGAQGAHPALSAPAQGALPAWVPPAREVAPLDREAAAAAVARAIQEIQQRRALPLDRLGSSAKSVLALWRALGRPPLDALAEDLALVAAWARESSDRLAARDLRAEGWEGQPNRSRSVDTLCRQTRWADRLAAAQAWDRRGRPVQAPGSAAAAAARVAAGGRPLTQDPFEALRDEERDLVFLPPASAPASTPHPSPLAVERPDGPRPAHARLAR